MEQPFYNFSRFLTVLINSKARKYPIFAPFDF